MVLDIIINSILVEFLDNANIDNTKNELISKVGKLNYNRKTWYEGKYKFSRTT